MTIKFYTALFIYILSILVSFAQQHNTSGEQSRIIDSLFNILKTDKEDTNKVKHHIQLCDEYRNTGDYNKGLQHGKISLGLSKKINFMKGIANSYNNIGNIYYSQGNFDKALENYFASLKLVRDGNMKTPEWKKIAANAHNNIGVIYKNQGNYKKSLENHLASLKYREETGDKKGTAMSYTNIGAIYCCQENYIKAMENHLASLKINKELEYKRGIAIDYTNIGNIYWYQDNYDKALEYHLVSLKIREETGDKYGMAASYNNIGIIYDDKADYEKALVRYFAALKIHEEIENKLEIASCNNNIANVYFKQNKIPEAKKRLLISLNLAKEIDAKNEMKHDYYLLSRCDSTAGNWKGAYRYYQLYSEIKNSIFNETNNKQITEMQTKYETEKKQKENEILAKENKIKSLEINQQKNQIVILITVFAFILFAGLLIFNRIRLKQKNKILTEKKLRANAVFRAQEKEKVYLSKELHDGLGPLLSLIKLNVSSLEVNTENEKMIFNIKNLASEGMKEVRNISHTLMPTLLEKKGLEPALTEFTGQINQTCTVKVELTFSVSSNLSQDMELNFFRIIQEAVNNILNHAEATSAAISLIEKKQQIELIISDNGKGFDIDKTLSGNGLNNIYMRVDFLKGKIKIISEKENLPAACLPARQGRQGGTTFLILIPVNKYEYA